MAKKQAKKTARRASAAARSKVSASAAAPSLATMSFEKRPTINDVARLANVSKKTVSRVINESPFVRDETRKRVAEIIAQLGFTPDPQARGLAFRRSYLMGLIYDNPNAPYVINIQEGALSALRKKG